MGFGSVWVEKRISPLRSAMKLRCFGRNDVCLWWWDRLNGKNNGNGNGKGKGNGNDNDKSRRRFPLGMTNQK